MKKNSKNSKRRNIIYLGHWNIEGLVSKSLGSKYFRTPLFLLKPKISILSA
jgi:hypothetical protein